MIDTPKLTEFEAAVYALLPYGEDNAILQQDLARAVGKTSRHVRSAIKVLREHGYPIVSRSAGGYYLPTPKDKKDAQRFCNMMRRQAQERIRSVQAVDDWLVRGCPDLTKA
jgi:biotin operon repressor